jgi:hypothetical protein
MCEGLGLHLTLDFKKCEHHPCEGVGCSIWELCTVKFGWQCLCQTSSRYSNGCRLDLSASDCLNQQPGDGKYNCLVTVSPEGSGVNGFESARMLEAEIELSGSRLLLHFLPAAEIPRHARNFVCIMF